MSEKETSLILTDFKGMRDDRGQMFLQPDFLYDVRNFEFRDLIGFNKILFPQIINDLGLTDGNLDGIFEYRYLDEDNEQVVEGILLYNGTLYKNLYSTSTVIKTGLTPGIATFDILNDVLFISNGKDYPFQYDGTYTWEMGAPKAQRTGNVGLLNGSYYYEMTYVTAGGEERIGTRSNTVIALGVQVLLDIPIGYAGTTSRKIYRTAAGGSTPKLLATIADNSTATYTDNIADGSLGANIIAINNECPKPYFIQTSNDRLLGTVSDKFPTQLWPTDIEITVFDAANFEDISNNSSDNTPTVGMSIDYDKVIVGTQKTVYVVDASEPTLTVTRSRANIGVKNGYSMTPVPSSEQFPGGVVFLSTLNDVRVFNGNYNLPVPTSLDNLKAANISKYMRNLLNSELSVSNPHVFARFFDYKYTFILNGYIIFFDIRLDSGNGGWGYWKIQTDTYTPMYNVMGIFNSALLLGQKDASIIEKAYALTTYRDETANGYVQTGQVLFSEEFKFIKSVFIYFVVASGKKIQLTITTDGDYNNAISEEIELGTGAYLREFYSPEFFEVSDNLEDFREVSVNRNARAMVLKIESEDPVYIRGYKVNYDNISNGE